MFIFASRRRLAAPNPQRLGIIKAGFAFALDFAYLCKLKLWRLVNLGPRKACRIKGCTGGRVGGICASLQGWTAFGGMSDRKEQRRRFPCQCTAESVWSGKNISKIQLV